MIVYDLDVDPAPLLELDADEIADRVFTPRADLPDDIERIPLKTVHANKSPALAPLSVLNGVDTARIGLDIERCLRCICSNCKAPMGWQRNCARFFRSRAMSGRHSTLSFALYAGFPNDADQRLLREVRTTPPAELAARKFAFKDARYTELLFRYRARNWPQTLSTDEAERWIDFRRGRLNAATDATALTLTDYDTQIAQLRAQPNVTPAKLAILDQLEAWGNEARGARDP